MMTNTHNRISVLFVCLGNICRSPSAQIVLEYLLSQRGLEKHIHVDSCGTAAYHIGKAPDARSRQAAAERGYLSDHLRARKLETSDFQNFDYILAMDEDNLDNILNKKPPKSKAKLFLFMDFHPDETVREVPDPYYGGEQGFEYVLDLLEVSSEHFLDFLCKSHDL